MPRPVRKVVRGARVAAAVPLAQGLLPPQPFDLLAVRVGVRAAAQDVVRARDRLEPCVCLRGRWGAAVRRVGVVYAHEVVV